MSSLNRLVYQCLLCLLWALPVGAQNVEVVLSSPIRSLGVDTGRLTEVFGAIGAAATLSGGRLLVIDVKLGQLSMFTDQGNLLSSAGRIGQGPGEVIDPRLVGVSRDSLIILDLGTLRASVFSLAPRGIQYERSFTIGGFPADGCLLGNRMFILSYSDAGILHEYSLAGSRLRSFGSPLGVDAPITRGGTINSRVVCSERTKGVFVLSRQLGIVAAFSVDSGTMRWEVVPNGVRPIDMTIHDEGRGMRTRMPEGGYFDRLAAGVLLAPDLIAVQSIRTQYKDKNDPRAGVATRVLTFLLDRDTGALRGPARDDLPLMLEAKNGHVWNLENEEFPRISFRTFHLRR